MYRVWGLGKYRVEGMHTGKGFYEVKGSSDAWGFPTAQVSSTASSVARLGNLGGGVGGKYVRFSDSHLNLQNAVFREPSCKNSAFMLHSIRLSKHPSPNHYDVHVREHPLAEHPCPNYNNVHVRDHALLDHPCPSYKHVCLTSTTKYWKHYVQWDDDCVLSGP